MKPQSLIAYAIYRIAVLRIRIYDFKGVSADMFALNQARLLRGMRSW